MLHPDTHDAMVENIYGAIDSIAQVKRRGLTPEQEVRERVQSATTADQAPILPSPGPAGRGGCLSSTEMLAICIGLPVAFAAAVYNALKCGNELDNPCSPSRDHLLGNAFSERYADRLVNSDSDPARKPDLNCPPYRQCPGTSPGSSTQTPNNNSGNTTSQIPTTPISIWERRLQMKGLE